MSTNTVLGLLRRRTTTAGEAATHTVAAKGLATLAVTAVAGLAVTGTGVYALLRAQASNATPSSVAAGSLVLTLNDVTGTGGFTTAVSAMGPLDTVNRYVELRNTGSLDGQGLTLQVTDGTPSPLTADAVRGLRVTLTSCSVAWTVPSTTAASTCSGGAGQIALATTPVNSLGTTPLPLVPAALSANGVSYLKVGLSLPDSNEVVVNGSIPSTSVQGKTAALTWTFSLDQKPSANPTTNS